MMMDDSTVWSILRQSGWKVFQLSRSKLHISVKFDSEYVLRYSLISFIKNHMYFHVLYYHTYALE